MADDADRAAANADEHLTASLAAINAAIPAGAAGECDQCGDHFARLVGGLCGFCRDGRRKPPPRWRTDPVPPEPSHHHEEEEEMTLPATAMRKISIEGAALRLIEHRATLNEISFKQAAEELIVAKCGTEDADQQTGEIDATIFSDDELLDELRRRCGSAAMRNAIEADLAEMTGRAVTAERRLAQIKSTLLGDEA